jgi:hypothetical protein
MEKHNESVDQPGRRSCLYFLSRVEISHNKFSLKNRFIESMVDIHNWDSCLLCVLVCHGLSGYVTAHGAPDKCHTSICMFMLHEHETRHFRLSWNYRLSLLYLFANLVALVDYNLCSESSSR